MKSIMPGSQWEEEQPHRVFESRFTKKDTSTLLDNDKRMFRFLYGEEGRQEKPEDPDAASENAQRSSYCRRLFCSRFIKIRKG